MTAVKIIDHVLSAIFAFTGVYFQWKGDYSRAAYFVAFAIFMLTA